jgi:hypothetical protein
MLALGFVSGGAVACEDDAEVALATPTTCNDVCDRYRTCYAADFDVDACTAECDAETADSERRQERLDDCKECLDGSSCLEAFRCTDDCIGLLNVRR